MKLTLIFVGIQNKQQILLKIFCCFSMKTLLNNWKHTKISRSAKLSVKATKSGKQNRKNLFKKKQSVIK